MRFLKNYKSIGVLILTHLRNLFFDLKKLVLLFFVICFLMLSFHHYISNAKKPTIAIVTDDKSFQMNLVVDNLKNSNVKETFNVERRDKGDIDDAVFVAQIEDDAINKMETDPPIDIELSYNRNEPLSTVIKSYVDSVVKFINSTQKSAMLYWSKLKEANISLEDRFSKLNGLSLFVVTSFTARDSFSESKVRISNYTIMFISVLILVIAMFINNDILGDIRTGLYERLIINGFTSFDYVIYLSVESSLEKF